MRSKRHKRTRLPNSTILVFLVIALCLGALGICGYIFQERETSEEAPQSGRMIDVEPLSPTKQEQIVGESSPKEETQSEKSEPIIAVWFSASVLEQGDTFVIRLPEERGRGAAAFVNGSEVPLTSFGEQWLGIYGINGKAETGSYAVRVSLQDGSTEDFTLRVLQRNYPVTELVVSEELEEQGYTETKITESIAGEDKVLRMIEVLKGYTKKMYATEPFGYPLESVRNVGAFGNIRKGQGTALHHWGVDLDALVGTPVFAVNDGVVRFAEEGLYSYGTTMIVDHGLGIYSLYLHLNEMLAREGEQVEKGEVIAYSGNTGYSLAPHLHFGIKVRGANIDPLRFIQTLQDSIRS